MPQVYSTSSNSGFYCLYEEAPKDDRVFAPRKIFKKIMIEGGHNVAIAPEQKEKQNKFRGIHTPYGVATFVSKEDMDMLLKNERFKKHVAAGFLKLVEGEDKNPSPEKHVQSMQQRDKSAPLTNKEFKKSDSSEGLGIVTPVKVSKV